jgi:thiol-disulfide isomerase/thioredoxin
MRNFFIGIFLLLSPAFLSCKQSLPYGPPVQEPENILKDQRSFMQYWYGNLNLWEDFNALDTSGKTIFKGEFLKQVSKGNYLPLRLTPDTSNYYKLYKINTRVDKLISIWLKDIGNSEYSKYQWEAKAIPAINYRDLKGRIYNQQTIEGKVLVLDFWFIHCTACVAEMPELNKLVNQYKDRKDILFAAIAFDKEQDLKKFLAKTTFNYAVISDTVSYLGNALGVRVFPTAVVIDKKGKVVKIINSYGKTYKVLESVLKKEASGSK